MKRNMHLLSTSASGSFACCNDLEVEIEDEDLYFDPEAVTEDRVRPIQRLLPTLPLPHSQLLWRYERKPGSRIENNSRNEDLQLINTLSFFRMDGRFRSVEDEYWDVKGMKNVNNIFGGGLRRIFLQMHRVPVNITMEEVVQWFKPTVQVDVRNVFIHQNKVCGKAQVDIYFSSDKEARKAMRKDGQFMLKRRIELFYAVDVLKSVRPKLINNQLQNLGL